MIFGGSKDTNDGISLSRLVVIKEESGSMISGSL
jgi:hypothetical protein